MLYSNASDSLMKRLLRLLAGITAMVTIVAFLSSGYSPPGICGQVLRHNQTYEIDASPLFYSEVENMSELEEGLTELRQARLGRDDALGSQATSNNAH